jgi:FkbM family methyltransferase
MIRTLRLTAAALVAAALCAAYFYFFEPRTLYATYRCVTAATPWYACYTGNGFPFRTEVFGMIYEGRTGIGDVVDEMVLTQGSYETHVLFFLRDTMAKLNPSGGVFVDVGANTGQHSMFMSRYAKALHSFEPFPPVLVRFRRMLEINKITNVIVHPVGLGSEAARLPFDDRELSFSLGAGNKARPTLELEIVPGDVALRRAGVDHVDLIKMDIEGYENQALRGLGNTLRRDRPVVVFELSINPKRPGLFASMAELREVFPENYDFLAFKQWDFYTGFYELADLAGLAHFDQLETYNAVAYPREKKDQIALKTAVPMPSSLH